MQGDKASINLLNILVRNKKIIPTFHFHHSWPKVDKPTRTDPIYLY